MTPKETDAVQRLLIALDEKGRADDAFHWIMEFSEDRDRRRAAYDEKRARDEDLREARLEVAALVK